MGYGGFFMFRQKVAELCDSYFGKHYGNLQKGSFLFGYNR